MEERENVSYLEKENLSYLVEEILSLRDEVKDLRRQVQEKEIEHSESTDLFCNEREGPENVERAILVDTKGEPPLIGEEGDEYKEEPYELPADIFTLMFFSPIRSISFIYGLLVYLIQLLILSLVCYDLLQDEETGDMNRLNFAMDVQIQVRLAQIVAVFIAVLSRDDCLDTFNIVVVGYIEAWKCYSPGASYLQFSIMNILRFSEGSAVIFVSFVLIVQADNVLDLFFNFAAIEFVASLDNLAFDLAAQGWFLTSMFELAERIHCNKVYLTERESKRIISHPIKRRAMITGMLFAMFFGLWKVSHRDSLLQVQDYCALVDVTFGDEIFSFDGSLDFQGFDVEGRQIKESPLAVFSVMGSNRTIGSTFDPESPPDLHYAFFSGPYEADVSVLVGGRPVYYEKGFKDITSGKFYFCEDEGAWVFTIEALAQAQAVPLDTIDSCTGGGWLARSPATDAHSLDEVPIEGWRIWTGQLIQANGFSLFCADCSTDLDCGLNHGQCIDQKCECDSQYEGLFCTHAAPCDELARYYLSGVVTDEATEYQTYGRTSYARSLDDTDMLEFLLFVGCRWYSTIIPPTLLSVYDEGKFVLPLEEWQESFSYNFHGFWSNLILDYIDFFSERTNVQTPVGSIDWFQRTASEAVGDYGAFGSIEEINTQFECVSVDCSVTKICGKFGSCQNVTNIALYAGTISTGLQGNQCTCRNNFTGHFCEFQNKLVYSDGEMLGSIGLDPFLAACAGPYADLPDCLALLYPDYIPGHS